MSQGYQEKRNGQRKPCRGAEGRPGGLDGTVESGEFPVRRVSLYFKERK